MRRDDELGKVVVEQLLVERQVEARAAVTQITRVILDRFRHFGGAQQLLDLRRLRFGGTQRGAIRQPQVDQQFRPAGGRKELLLHTQREAGQRRDESEHGCRDDQPAVVQTALDEGPDAPVERCRVTVVAVLLGFPAKLFGVEQQVTQIGREHDGDDPGNEQGDADDGEDREGVFAGTRFGQADRHEADGGDQRSGQHGKRGRRIGKGRRAEAVPALFHLDHHHLDGNDRVIDQQTERDDQGAERDALQIDSESGHQQEADRQNEWNRQGDDGASAHSQTEKGNRQDDEYRLAQRRHEKVHRLPNDLRLIGHDVQIDSQR